MTCIPGIIRHQGAKLQMLDLPGIIEGAKDGKGRGRQVIATARTCNVIVMVLDAAKPLTHKALIEHELEGFGMRLNKTPPDITYKKKDKGGVNIVVNRPLTKLSEETIRAICKEYRVISADFIFRSVSRAETSPKSTSATCCVPFRDFAIFECRFLVSRFA